MSRSPSTFCKLGDVRPKMSRFTGLQLLTTAPQLPDDVGRVYMYSLTEAAFHLIRAKASTSTATQNRTKLIKLSVLLMIVSREWRPLVWKAIYVLRKTFSSPSCKAPRTLWRMVFWRDISRLNPFVLTPIQLVQQALKVLFFFEARKPRVKFQVKGSKEYRNLLHTFWLQGLQSLALSSEEILLVVPRKSTFFSKDLLE